MALSQYPFKGGVPTGTTAQRPANPKTGDVFYDGTLGFLIIWEGTQWIPCSAPAAQPTISLTDVGTSRAYGSGAISVAFTEGTSGGKAAGFTAYTASGTSYTQTSTSNPVTLVVGNNGSYSISGTAYNGFGTSPAALTQTVNVTTVPQAPTIGSASTSSVTTDITVTWTLQNNGGKNLTSITITPYLGGTTAGTPQTASSTTATSHTFSGLTSNSSYTFKVKATNANGDSLESSASNSVTVPNLVGIEYLVVGGGASGGPGYQGGGGGAGGFRTGSFGRARGVNLTVTVGAGGAAVTGNTNAKGNSGGQSVFDTITSAGGGGGGTYNSGSGAGVAGGSGGGAGAAGSALYSGGAGNTPSTSPSQGNKGGDTSVYTSPYCGAGGGGAGAAGADGGNAVGNGGNGTASSITGTSVTYAGGGGGGNGDGNNAGAGGTGGGGAGAIIGSATPAVAGTANTGGGGGGGANNTGASSSSASGGSGVVILRWLTSDSSITVGAGLTADATGTDGSYSYKRFTAGTGNVSFS